MRITLVNGWRTWWRQWSTWLAGVGAAAVYLAPELAEGMQHAWQILPMDIKASFPAEWVRYFGAALTVLSIPAKLVRQRKLYDAVHPSDDDRVGAEGQPDVS